MHSKNEQHRTRDHTPKVISNKLEGVKKNTVLRNYEKKTGTVTWLLDQLKLEGLADNKKATKTHFTIHDSQQQSTFHTINCSPQHNRGQRDKW